MQNWPILFILTLNIITFHLCTSLIASAIYINIRQISSSYNSLFAFYKDFIN